MELLYVPTHFQVQSADDDTDFYAVWDALYSFTSPGDMYFGHEIDNILDLVVNLMDRQDWQMNGTENHLEFQVNTTQTGARIIDNLISHDAQWDQIESQVTLILIVLDQQM